MEDSAVTNARRRKTFFSSRPPLTQMFYVTCDPLSARDDVQVTGVVPLDADSGTTLKIKMQTISKENTRPPWLSQKHREHFDPALIYCYENQIYVKKAFQ